MRKTLLLLFSIFCFGAFVHAGTPVIITFEDAELGSTGGVVSVWDAGTIEVVTNTYTTGNSSGKVLRVQKASYMGLYFENLPLPEGAETQYSAVKVKYLIVGGTDINYPSLEIFSSPNNYTMGDTEKLGALPWANLWGEAEIGIWKTIEFSLSDSEILPIPAGNLILKLVKDDCEYLIDDIELVPATTPPAASAVIDFEDKEIGDTYSIVGWSGDAMTATVAANPSGEGKSLHAVGANWNSYPKFTVTLPEGKTLGDIQKITFDIYFSDVEGDQNTWKKIDYFFGEVGVAFTANEPTGTTDDNIIQDETKATWLQKEFLLPATLSDELKALNNFDFAFGINANTTDFYLDNITFVDESSSGLIDAKVSSIYFNNNTLHLNQAGNVQIFDTNGRLILAKQNVTTLDLSSVSRGVYIAKALVDGGVEIIKFVK